MIARRHRSIAGWPVVLLALAPPAAGCASQPAEIRLAEVEPGQSELLGAGAPAAELPVVELEHAGIRGGQITAVMPAAPERLLDRLLDFEGADGHRAWAKHYALIQRDGSRAVARWEFEGRLGIHPTAEIEFQTSSTTGSGTTGGAQHHVIEFRLLEPVFGLGAFFGDYSIDPAEAAAQDASVLVMRVFIDSGLPFVNASAEDIAAGLRADVRLLREWLTNPTPPLRPADARPSSAEASLTS